MSDDSHDTAAEHTPVHRTPTEDALPGPQDGTALDPAHSEPALPFPVVGIGASAGGLDALTTFFDALPERPGMAFIIVQHLSPDHHSELAALLQRHTALDVAQVTDDSTVKPDRVYVIPPGKSLSLQDGHLRLSEPEAPRGQRAPIDLFFRSLAEDQGENAIGVILSGTGSDGAQGLKVIKEAAGLTLAQDPEEAQYDGMPYSAVRTGLVDLVAPVAELAVRLPEVHRLAGSLPADGEDLPDTDAEALTRIFTLLRSRSGHDFSRYKRSSILRRLGRRLQVRQIETLPHYLRVLREHDAEADALLRDFLISVTNFFRDPETFAALEHDVMPLLFEGKAPGDRVRVWVPGCATGEEAYSIAILLCEYAGRLDAAPEIQIFATDIDEAAVASAREGLYPETIAADVSPERIARFFTVEAGGYRVRKEIRELILFTTHNLLENPPFSRLDLISCRNLLIYLQRDVQAKVFELFHYALRPSGFLFLGSSESADGGAHFRTISKKHRLYRTRPAPPDAPPFPTLPLTPRVQDDRYVARARPESTKPPPSNDVEARYMAWTLAHHAPPRLLVNDRHEITHAFGAGRYLTADEGAVSQNVLKRIVPSLRLDLRTALYRAFEKNEPTDTRFIPLDSGNGDAPHLVRLHVGPLHEGPLDGLVEVVFHEADDDRLLPPALDGEPSEDNDHALVVQLEEELLRTRERLQTIIEEHETSNEELQASNEELQSMNEELQSTAEELETSKEELQSMNEELVTVNQELKTKIEELGRVNADLQNLMDATEVPTLFFDRDLRLDRFTPLAATLFHVIPSDLGRPIGHLAHRLGQTDLAGYASRVLETLIPIEEEVCDDGGRWHVMRLSPYRTLDDHIDGIVATFVDVTRLKHAEAELHRRVAQQSAVAEIGHFALVAPALDALFDRACEAICSVIGSEMCKVLQLQPGGEQLLLRRGCGWKDGYVGEVTVPNDHDSQAGYTLEATEPVIVEDFAEETRFRAPTLLSEHDIVSGISVPIPGADGPWGVLGTHVRGPRAFTDEDARFLEAVSHILGEAIQRDEARATLEASEERLRLAMEGGALGAWIRDLESDTMTFDARARTLYDLDHAMSAGDALARVHPDDLAAVQEALARAIAPDDPDDVYAVDHRLTRRDGTVRWIAARGQARFRGTGTDRRAYELAGVAMDITAQKEAEQKSRRRAAVLEAVIESIPDAVYIGNEDGVTQCNARALALIGATSLGDLHDRSQVLEQRLNARDIASHEPLAPNEYPFFRALKGEVVIRDLLARHAATGEDFYLRAAAAPVEVDGEVIGAVAINTDISDRMRVEETLKAAEQRAREQFEALEVLYRAAPVGLALHDTDLRYLRINERLAAINGLPAEDHIGRRPHELFPDLADTIEPLMRQTIETGEPLLNLDIVTDTLAHPGEEHRYLVSYLPRRTPEGALDGLSVVVQDLTDLFRTEAALAEARARIAEEQARLAAILQQLPVGVLIRSAPDRHLSFANEAAERIVQGTSAGTGDDLDFDHWQPYHLDGQPYAREDLPIMRALRDGETIMGEEFMLPRPDGLPLYLRANAGPVRDAEGEIVAGVLAFEDISAEREAKKALHTLNETLEQRVVERTEQVRTLTTALTLAEQHERARIAQILHDDLQQVLYGLRLKLQSLTEDLAPLLEAHQEREGSGGLEHTEAADALARADALVLRALHLTRTLTLDLQPPILATEGFEASLAWLVQHMEQTHNLTVALHIESPVHLTDEHLHTLLFQFARELLFNVVKHSRVLSAVVYLRQDEHMLTLIVEDHGRGFDPAAPAGGPASDRRGFGLISIRERLALFGGQMNIHSIPSEGTRITLTLPLRDTPVSPDSIAP